MPGTMSSRRCRPSRPEPPVARTLRGRPSAGATGATENPASPARGSSAHDCSTRPEARSNNESHAPITAPDSSTQFPLLS
jgi:hypothetical protein